MTNLPFYKPWNNVNEICGYWRKTDKETIEISKKIGSNQLAQYRCPPLALLLRFNPVTWATTK